MYYYAFLLLGGGNFSSVWGELAAGYVAEVRGYLFQHHGPFERRCDVKDGVTEDT